VKLEGNNAPIHANLGNSASESTVNRMLFERDDACRLPARGDDRVGVNRLDGVHAQNAKSHAFGLKLVRHR
jgi:hypothetical protein